VLAASLNLVPGIGRSYQAIREAQRMRGWRPRGPRSWTELMVPVLLTALEDSIQLAESMEARAYGSGRRTTFIARFWARRDTIVVVATAVSILMFVAGRLSGAVTDWYPYPTPDVPQAWVPGLLACGLLLWPLIAWRSPPLAG
jgi:energy-coupling factor transport system permease protein